MAEVKPRAGTVFVHPEVKTGTITTFPDPPKRKFPKQPKQADPTAPVQKAPNKSVPRKKPWYVP